MFKKSVPQRPMHHFIVLHSIAFPEFDENDSVINTLVSTKNYVSSVTTPFNKSDKITHIDSSASRNQPLQRFQSIS